MPGPSGWARSRAAGSTCTPSSSTTGAGSPSIAPCGSPRCSAPSPRSASRRCFPSAQSGFLVGVVAGAWLGAAPPVEGEGVAAGDASLEGLLTPLPSDLLPELYRSLYQPPPLSWNELRLMIFAILPPHSGQASGGGSVTFCRRSTMRPHASQTNS